MSDTAASPPQHTPRRFPQWAVIRLSRVGWLAFIAPVGLGLALSASYVGAAMLNAEIFTELLTDRDMRVLQALIIALAIVLLTRPLLSLAREWAVSALGGRMKRTLRLRVSRVLTDQGPMRAPRRTSGQLESLMTDGIENTQAYYGLYLPHILVTAVTALFVGAWLAQYSIWIAIVQVFLAAVVVAVPRVWDKVLAERGQTHWIAYADLNSEFVDSMMGMTTLKAFNAATRRRETLAAKSEHLLKSTLGQLKLSLGETGVSGTIMVIGPAVGLAMGIAELARGTVQPTELFMITLLSAEMFRPVRTLANYWHTGYLGLSSSRELEAFLRAETEENTQATDPSAQPSPATPAGTSTPAAALEIHEARYRYRGAEADALAGVDLTLREGSSLAIVGASGSGKSTLLGLLLGIDAPSGGTLSVFGEDPRRSVARGGVIAMVAQDPLVFAGTVRSNLLDGRADASDDELLEALRIARLDTLDGATGAAVLDRVVHERGENLSGGQRQRLAIARSLVARPRLLVLDESTSALDTDTEIAVLDQIAAAMPQLTLVIVTHRMDTAARCDQAIVLKAGRAVEQGSVRELLASDSHLARMTADAAGAVRS